jgi:putative transposase
MLVFYHRVVTTTCAAHRERSPERINQRNGYRDRLWERRASTVELRIRKLPSWSGAGRPRRRSLGGAGSLRPLSRRSGQGHGHERHLQEPIKAFLSRPIEGDWPYLWIDATYVKVRQSGRIVSAAVIVAIAVNSDGRREVLGMDIGPSEAETFWTEFLRKLARRSLRGVKLVISDAHEGIKAAIAKVLHASWQRCRVHFMRNVLAHAGRRGRRVFAAFIGTAFVQDDAEAASKQWRAVADQLRAKVPKLAAPADSKRSQQAHWRSACLQIPTATSETATLKNPTQMRRVRTSDQATTTMRQLAFDVM